MKKVIVITLVLFSLNMVFVSCKDANKETVNEENTEMQIETEDMAQDPQRIEDATEEMYESVEESMETEESLEKVMDQDTLKTEIDEEPEMEDEATS